MARRVLFLPAAVLTAGTGTVRASSANHEVRRTGAGLRRTTQALPWITGLWLLVELIGLRLPLLRAFFFDTAHADVQGIDFYSLPKAWLNVRAGRSLYGTFDPPALGPHVTWYLAHPLLALMLGGPLSWLTPADSYGVFTLFSLALTAAAAWVLGSAASSVEADSPRLRRRALFLLFLTAFPTFLTLWVGNVQALLLLGLSLLFAGMLRLVQDRPLSSGYLVAGLLVSLFTKPVVLLMLPLLLLLPETRRATWQALAVYVPVSLLCLVVPALNPEGVGLGRVLWLAVHPGYVRSTMDIYANHLQLTPEMRDNSVHWLNLVAQSGFRLQHVDVYSLPVFLDGLVGVRTPDWIYTLPTALVLALSVAVVRMRGASARREAALLLLLAASLDFFLAYPTVWEYQYTAVLPVAAVLLLWEPRGVSPRMRWTCVALASCAWLPSLYFLSGSATPDFGVLLLARLDRVVPVTVLFGLLCWCVLRAVLSPVAPVQAESRPS